MSAGRLALLFAAAVVAGGVNAVAGGGTLITFPALLFVGLDPIVANATNTVALWPGTLGSIWGYRSELAERDALLGGLAVPSIAGGAAGALLLLSTPSRVFSVVVPFLILFGTFVFMLQSRIARRRGDDFVPRARTRGWWAAAAALGFVNAVYGGYFGAGTGILTLALLGALGLTDIHRMNGIKVVCGMLINGTAVVAFALERVVDVPIALTMVAGSAVGGYLGVGAARRIGQTAIRRAIVGIGLGVAAVLFWRLAAR